MSTFIVECDKATWFTAGFDRKNEQVSRQLCEQIFSSVLDGHPLIANKSSWRSFPWIWNRRWFHRNIVLIGDALHTAHYSIGSGTRLAMEDAVALVRSLEAHPRDPGSALESFQAQRQPAVEKLVAASKVSAAWYADFPKHMKLAPVELAHSYIIRSGRVDPALLRAMAPGFAERLQQAEKGKDRLSS
jgi:2-polyprenyl-6-methoxyphenol hydroxylase-like FAD-dependent oxidoreductase